MKKEKECQKCGKTFKEAESEPFITCPLCRIRDTAEHKQERKAEPRAYKNGPDDWEDLLDQEADQAADWDDIHRAYEDQQ